MSAAETWEELEASDFQTQLSEGFLIREGNTILQIKEISANFYKAGWSLSTPRGYQPLPPQSEIQVYEFEGQTIDEVIDTRRRTLTQQNDEARRIDSLEVYPIPRSDTALGVNPPNGDEQLPTRPFLESDLPDGQTTTATITDETDAARYVNTTVFIRNANGVVIEAKVVETTGEAPGLLIRSDVGTADYRYYLPSSSVFSERDVDLVSVSNSPGSAPESALEDDTSETEPDDTESELTEDIQDEVTEDNPDVGFPDPSPPLFSRMEVIDPIDTASLNEGDLVDVLGPYVVQKAMREEGPSNALLLGYDGTVRQSLLPQQGEVFVAQIPELDVDDVSLSSEFIDADYKNVEDDIRAYQPPLSATEILGASISNPGFDEESIPITKLDIDSQFDINPYIRSQDDAEELITKQSETTQHVIYRSQGGYLNIGNAYNVPDDGAGLMIGAGDGADPSYKWYLPSSGKQDQNDVDLVAIPKQEYIDENKPTILNGRESVADAIVAAASDVDDTPTEPADTGSDDTVADDSEIPDDPDERGQEDVPYDPDFVNDIIERFFEDVTVSFAQSPARALATAFDTFDEILDATPRTLLGIDGVGDGTVERLTGVENPARDIPVDELRSIDEEQEPVEFVDVDPEIGISDETQPFDGRFDASDTRQRIKAATRDPPKYIRADALDRDIKAGDLVAYDLMRGAQAWAVVYPEEIPSVADENGDPRLAAEIFLLGGPGDDGSFVDTYDDDNDGWINTGGFVETQTSVPRDPENFNWVVRDFTGEQDGSVAGGGPSQEEINQVVSETQELLEIYTQLRNAAVSEELDPSRIDEEISDIQNRIEQLQRLNTTQGYTRGDLAEKTAANRETRQKAEDIQTDIDANDLSIDEDAVDTVDEAVQTVEEVTDAQADEDVVEDAVETAQEATTAEGVPESKEEDTEDEVAAALAKYRSTAPSDDDEPEPEPESESEPEPDQSDDTGSDSDDTELRGPQIDSTRTLTEDQEREAVARIEFGNDTQQQLADEFDVTQSTINRVIRTFNDISTDDKASLDQIIQRDYEAAIQASLPDEQQSEEAFPGPYISETTALDEDREREIVVRSAFGGESYADIAEQYPVSASTVGRIVNAYNDITGDDREELEVILLEQYDYVIDDELPEDEKNPRDQLRDKLDDDTDASDDMDTEPEPDDDDDTSDTSIQEEQKQPDMNQPSNIAENRVDAALIAGGVPYDTDDVGIPVEITRDSPKKAWILTPVSPLPDAIASAMDSSLGVLTQTEQSTDAFLEEAIRAIVGSHTESVRDSFDYDMAFDAADIEPPTVEDAADVDDSPPEESPEVGDVFEEVYDIVTDNTTASDQRELEAERLLQEKLYEFYPQSELSGGGMSITLEFDSQAQGVLQGGDAQADGERIVFEAGVDDPTQYNFFESEDGIVGTPLLNITPEGIKRAFSGLIDLLDMRNPSVDEFADITRKFGAIQNVTEFSIEQSTADWANLFLDGEEYTEITLRQPSFFRLSYTPEIRSVSRAMVAAQRVYFAVSGFERGQQNIENDIAGDPLVSSVDWYIREAYLRAQESKFDPAAFTYAFYDYAISPPGRGEPIPDVDTDEVGKVTDGMGIPGSGSAPNTAIVEDPEDVTTSWRDLTGASQQTDTQSQQQQRQQPTQAQTQPQPDTQQQQTQQQQQIQQQADEMTGMSERNDMGGGLSPAARRGSEPEPEPEPEPTGNLSDPPLYEGDEGLPRLTYRSAMDAQSVADDLGVNGIHVHTVPTPSGDEETVYMPGATHDALNTELNNRGLEDAPLPEQVMQTEVQQQQRQQQQRQQQQRQQQQRQQQQRQQQQRQQQQRQQQQRQPQSIPGARTETTEMQQGVPGARTPMAQAQQQDTDSDMGQDAEEVETFPIILTPTSYAAGEVGERFRVADEAQRTIANRVRQTIGPVEEQFDELSIGDKVGETILSEDGIVDIDIAQQGEQMMPEDTTRQTPSQQEMQPQQQQQMQPQQQQMQQGMQGETFPAQSLPGQVSIVSSRATMAQMPDTGDIKSGAAEGFVIDALVDETASDNMVTVRVSEPDGDNGRVMTVSETTTAQEVVDMALNGEGQPISAPEVREIRGGGRL